MTFTSRLNTRLFEPRQYATIAYRIEFVTGLITHAYLAYHLHCHLRLNVVFHLSRQE